MAAFCYSCAAALTVLWNVRGNLCGAVPSNRPRKPRRPGVPLDRRFQMLALLLFAAALVAAPAALAQAAKPTDQQIAHIAYTAGSGLKAGQTLVFRNDGDREGRCRPRPEVGQERGGGVEARRRL